MPDERRLRSPSELAAASRKLSPALRNRPAGDGLRPGAARRVPADPGRSMHFVSISAATVFAAWYCGLWPATLATVAGTLAANALFVPPYHLLGPITQKAILGEILFVVFCGAIIALGKSRRRAVLRLGHVHEVLLRSRTHLKFRVRERTAELRQMNESLRDLSARLLRVQDDERRRIARDLHDSTGQALTALKMELAGIERELAARNPQLALRLGACIADARQISDELRTISYLLHPPLLDELGLGSALRWYAEGFEKRSGIKVHLELDNPNPPSSGDGSDAVPRGAGEPHQRSPPLRKRHSYHPAVDDEESDCFTDRRPRPGYPARTAGSDSLGRDAGRGIARDARARSRLRRRAGDLFVGARHGGKGGDPGGGPAIGERRHRGRSGHAGQPTRSEGLRRPYGQTGRA